MKKEYKFLSNDKTKFKKAIDLLIYHITYPDGKINEQKLNEFLYDGYTFFYSSKTLPDEEYITEQLTAMTANLEKQLDIYSAKLKHMSHYLTHFYYHKRKLTDKFQLNLDIVIDILKTIFVVYKDVFNNPYDYFYADFSNNNKRYGYEIEFRLITNIVSLYKGDTEILPFEGTILRHHLIHIASVLPEHEELIAVIKNSFDYYIDSINSSNSESIKNTQNFLIKMIKQRIETEWS